MLLRGELQFVKTQNLLVRILQVLYLGDFSIVIIGFVFHYLKGVGLFS
jgi:hypothetical protein